MRRSMLAVICLSAVLLQGCIFSPKKGDEKPPPPQPYEKPVSPSAVIRNLALAYKQKDSVAYVACYDLDYTGSSLDQLDPTPQLISVTWDDEAKHIGFVMHSAISRIEDEVSQTLDRDRFHDGGYPANWDAIQNPFTKLEIDDPNLGKTWSIPFGAGDIHIFRFIGVPNSGAADSTWKIISWEEVRSSS